LNAVEIEEAVSLLAEQPFSPENFPYAFLEAFGNKETTIKRLRAGASNKSDVGGVLQTNNIHIGICNPGDVTRTLTALRQSPATAKAKAKFVLATDGVDFEAEELTNGDTVACAYKDFPDHFGFFLALAGISTVRQIAENSFDIRATSRLNRLYLELRKDNPDWETGDRRHDMNHFMARLIFCFFAEDTGIFYGSGLFTDTITQMSDRDSSNTHEVVSTLFRAMNTKIEERGSAKLPRWADGFPYVNGGLFSGNLEVPRFSKIARSYLLHIGNLDWQKINPDIFGSMIQAVAEDADDDDRRQLGMHYTSVPNILKVLNPLFLDDLRAKLVEAGDNPRMLLNLRNRMARIRVFDPACGSGNFLVIAYKEMRAIEADINKLRGELEKRSVIPKTNFRGIEIRDFPAEVARLALVIAEYQCDVLYRGHKLALAEFLPLDRQNWITCGNPQTGAIQIEIKGLATPKGKEATRICQEDLNEVIAAFVQDKPAIEHGMFNGEIVTEELTQSRMGKIVKEKYPELDAEDQEAVRQHAIAALNFTQQGKQFSGSDSEEPKANTALIDGIRRYAMDVRELDIDLIDRINPFGEAYAILAKTMSEKSLKEIAAAIAAKRTALTPEDAKALAARAVKFKKERGRVPSPTSQDPWERRMAEGAAAFLRFDKEGRYAR
jgi:hypothetical protein